MWDIQKRRNIVMFRSDFNYLWDTLPKIQSVLSDSAHKRAGKKEQNESNIKLL